MRAVIRTLAAVGLSVALPLGALCAPLLHAHLDDHHADHHDANRVHAHLGGHDVDHHDASSEEQIAEGRPEVAPDADPEGVTRLQVFVAVHPGTPAAPALPLARYTLPAPLESIMRRPPVVVHSHGPPSVSSAGSRAPPAFPS